MNAPVQAPAIDAIELNPFATDAAIVTAIDHMSDAQATANVTAMHAAIADANAITAPFRTRDGSFKVRLTVAQLDIIAAAECVRKRTERVLSLFAPRMAAIAEARSRMWHAEFAKERVVRDLAQIEERLVRTLAEIARLRAGLAESDGPYCIQVVGKAQNELMWALANSQLGYLTQAAAEADAAIAAR